MELYLLPPCFFQLDILDLEENSYRPDHEVFRSLASTVRQKLELDLIGIDVIIDNHSGRYAVIDINSFPGNEISALVCSLFLFVPKNAPRSVKIRN